jgi:hypothetical protein
VFAAIAGSYPPVGGDAAEALERTLADQLEAGLGILADGAVRDVTTEEQGSGAIRAWLDAVEVAGMIAGATGLPVTSVKACLTGPLSMSGPAGRAIDRIARVLHDLFAAGAPVVQLHEPWLATPEAASAAGRERARSTWLAALAGVTGHVTLAIPGGGASAAGAEVLAAAPFSSYLLDLVTGPGDWRVAAKLPGERGLVLGVADLRTPAQDPLAVLVWAARYAASMQGRGVDRVGLAPSAGLERLTRVAARSRLARLAEAARLAGLPGEELAGALEPAAVDARSAALGRWDPPARRRRPPPRARPSGSD